ncbi:MAG: hypothetical protein M1827_003706 [Pycnora praestabilis]|nr:MAG: hypothetical protein M1827_003706 [Pycnora praestabilis]
MQSHAVTLARSFELPNRFGTKDIDFFSSPLDDPCEDLFNQYVTMGPFESSDSFSTSSDPQISFEISSLSSKSEPVGTSVIPGWDLTRAESHQPWRTAPWSIDQNAASPSFIRQGNRPSLYQETTGRAAISDTQLLSLEGKSRSQIHSSLAPSSPPSTPSPTSSKKAPKIGAAVAKTIRKREASPGKKKNSLSSSMLRPSHYRSNMPAFHNTWAHRLESAAGNIDLQMPANDLPLSPPPSLKVDYSFSNRLVVPNESSSLNGFDAQAYEQDLSPHQSFSSSASQSRLSPLSSPLINVYRAQRPSLHQRSASGSIGYPSTPYNNHEALNSIHTPPPTQPLSSWNPNTNEPINFGFDASSNFQTSQAAQPWWPSTSTCTTQDPAANYQFTPSQAQQASKSLMQMTNGASYMNNATSSEIAAHGLMIRCDPREDESMQDMDPSSDYFSASNNVFTSASPPPQFEPQQEQAPYTPDNISPTNTTCIPTAAPSSRSPSISPNRVQLGITKQHRRKSSNTPRTPSSSAQGGFVNFTPSDSRKILTGVAPSGSSKTKARREKEAEQKRRRLSEAAVRAVREAGGNLDSLENIGLY